MEHLENDTEAKETDIILVDGNLHYPYTTDFENEGGETVRHTFHFRRPQRQHILMIAKAGKDKVFDSQKEVLVQLALPDERAQARVVFDEYPLTATAFADEIFKTAGAGSVFRGK